jgi:hypothetical protein
MYFKAFTFVGWVPHKIKHSTISLRIKACMVARGTLARLKLIDEQKPRAQHGGQFKSKKQIIV